MEKTLVVTVANLAQTMEQRIAEFIINNVDKDHFGCIDEYEDGDMFDFDLYDKDRINAKLKDKNKKKLAKITFAGNELYNVIVSLDITINRKAFTFLAFLKDLHLGVKTL